MRPINPYIAGPPLHGEKGFFGRHDTLDWVEGELQNPGTNALVLFGQRRIGKTTILLQLQRTLKSDAFLPVYFDLQYKATRPLGYVLAELAGKLARIAGLATPDRDNFDHEGHFFCNTFLNHLYQTLDKGCRPVLLIDEFDVLDQVDEAKLSEIAAARALLP